MTDPGTVVSRAPVALWFFLALAIAMATLVWHRFALDDEDRDWLDPGQPPINIPLDFQTRTVSTSGPIWRAPKLYAWGSLTQDPGCWVGDC